MLTDSKIFLINDYHFPVVCYCSFGRAMAVEKEHVRDEVALDNLFSH